MQIVLQGRHLGVWSPGHSHGFGRMVTVKFVHSHRLFGGVITVAGSGQEWSSEWCCPALLDSSYNPE